MSAYQCCGTYDDDQHAPNCVMKELTALRSENARLEKLVNDTVFNREETAITRALRQHFGVQDLLEENARLREAVRDYENGIGCLWRYVEGYPKHMGVRQIVEKLRDRERGR